MTEVQAVIDRIQAHQKEQGFCLAALALWDQVQAQGINTDPEDGGPMLMCVCPNAKTAMAIKSDLDLVSKL